MIKITTILFAIFWLTVGSVPTYYATMEYTELKLAAKPAQDRQDLAALGFIPDFVDSQQYSMINN